MILRDQKIPYRMKAKMFDQLPGNIKDNIKEMVIDHYSNMYDCDSKELRDILNDLNNKTLSDIEKELS